MKFVGAEAFSGKVPAGDRASRGSSMKPMGVLGSGSAVRLALGEAVIS
jgi:hypothetical protein